MSSTAKACARCYRLKVKCKFPEGSEGEPCQRCRSAKADCTPRPILSGSSPESQRSPSSKQQTIESLSNKVAELCENVARLQEKGGQHSKLWRDFTEPELYGLFGQYSSLMAEGFPIVPRSELLDAFSVRTSRPLLFRAACCVAVGSTDPELCLALVRENYKYLCEYNLTDNPASMDFIQALYITAIYIPYAADPAMLRLMIGAHNLIFQTLQELQYLNKPMIKSLEFDRCKIAVYFLCNSVRLWQKNEIRLITWNASHDAAADSLMNGDASDRAFVESVRLMKLAEGISLCSFSSSPEFTTEEIFRQYLTIYQAQDIPHPPQPITFAQTMVPLFRMMNCIPIIDNYLDLCKEGDDTVNVTLCFEAIVNEGQGLVQHVRRLCDSHVQYPTFFYLRTLRGVLSIAYFCRTWGHAYYEQLIAEVWPMWNQLILKQPFLIRTRPFLEGVDTWYRNYNALEPTASMSEILDKIISDQKLAIDSRQSNRKESGSSW